MSAQPQVTTARIADWLWSQDLGYTIDDDRNIVLRFEAFTIYIFVGAEFSDLLPVRGYWRPELADTDLERVDAHIRQYTLGGVVVKLGISRRAAPPPRHLFAQTTAFIGKGMCNEQLADYLNMAVSVIGGALQEAAEALPDLAQRQGAR